MGDGYLTRLSRWWRTAQPRPDGYLAWAEIEDKYPGEWVLLDEPTVDRWDEVTGGTLLLHNHSRAALDAEWPERQLHHFAILHVFDPHAPDPDELILEPEWTDSSASTEDSSTSKL